MEVLKINQTLSDNIRLRIINILSVSDLYVCEIVGILKLPQSTVSRHLALLKNANIVSSSKEGFWIKYSLLKNEIYKYFIKNIVDNALLNTDEYKQDLIRTRQRIKLERGCPL